MKQTKNSKAFYATVWAFGIMIFLGATAWATTLSDTTSTFTGDLDLDQNNISDVSSINGIYYVQEGNASDIQAKINLCPSTGCKIIIPDGYYEIESQILMPQNVWLSGSGINSTYIKLANSVNDHMVEQKDSNSNGFRISSMTLDANKQGQTSDVHGIRLEGVEKIVIDNVKLINSKHHGFNLNVDNSQFTNLYAEDSGNGSIDGVNYIITGSYNILDTIYGSGSSYHGLQFYGPNNVVNNFIIVNSGSNGFENQQDAGQNILSNGVIKNSTGQGINVEANPNGTIIENVIIDRTGSRGINIIGDGVIVKNVNIISAGTALGGAAAQREINIQADNIFLEGIYATDPDGTASKGYLEGDNIQLSNSKLENFPTIGSGSNVTVINSFPIPTTEQVVYFGFTKEIKKSSNNTFYTCNVNDSGSYLCS